MGMAASQARFLTLTARKSNDEYEGQQVNQQRTSLSNESAGLFNKMMELQVPTPPSATDFYNTRYTFDAKGSDYSITNSVPRTDGKYDITITYKASVPVGREYNTYGTMNFAGDIPTTLITNFNGVDTECNIEVLTRDNDGNFVDSKGVADANVKTVAETAKENLESEENANYYRYTYNNTNYYISGTNMKDMLEKKGSSSSYVIASGYPNGLSTYYASTQDLQKEITAVGGFPSSTTEGRFEQLYIEDVKSDDPRIVEALKDKTFDLSLTQVQDDEGYAEAMKDYEYQKMLYERTINDINAQTEIIQQQDRTLELRLKQLDTEQNALNTELEAVKKVIEQNVEATFKTFA